MFMHNILDFNHYRRTFRTEILCFRFLFCFYKNNRFLPYLFLSLSNSIVSVANCMRVLQGIGKSSSANYAVHA